MKTLLLSIALLFASQLYSQADRITGTWLSEEKDAKIKVYEKGGAYFGKLVWIAEDVGPDGGPKLDVNNPDPDKRDERLLGKLLLTGLEWDADEKEWNEGEIYDPKSGSTYDLFARLEDSKTLYLKGYIGFSLIGRSTLWTRVD